MTAIGLIFAVLAIMVAALSVVIVEPAAHPTEPSLNGWPLTTFMSVAASVLAVVSLLLVLIRGHR